ncbi:hypothetical protein ACFRKB_37350 [Streptomyces scopuliridis]|uniref:hypothetical protein n=1 Tax=Streptomyces scopuliridis TaxID=452529 RepID=UPI003685C1B0
MTMSPNAEAYYAAHTQHLRERGAANAARIWPGQALQYTTLDGAQFLPFPSRLSVASVRPAVRSARKKHTVHEYDIAARDGSPLRIVYLRYAPGTWSNVDEVVDVYEVPVEALTAL